MAIAYQGQTSASAFPGTSITSNITTSGSKVTILMLLRYAGSSANVNSPTFDGAALTKLLDWVDVDGTVNSVWYITNANIGSSKALTATNNSSKAFVYGAVWYSGTSDTIDTSSGVLSTVTGNVSQSLTPTVDNCWTVLFAQGGVGSSPTAGANIIIRQTAVGTIGDSGAAISPIASKTLNITGMTATTTVFGSVSLAPAPLTDNLVSYYKLDESSGDAADSVGSNTLTNTGTTTYGAAKINNGADGGSTNTGKYLKVANNMSIDGGACSFSVWVKIATAPSSGNVMGIIGQYNPSNSIANRIYYWNDSGTYKVYFNRLITGISNNGPAVTYTLTVGSWYLLTYTYDGVNVTGYINGVSAGSAGGGSGSGSDSNYHDGVVLMAMNSTSYGSYLSGMIDEAGVWSRALNSDEVSKLYNSNRALAYPLTAPTLYGGVASYKLDESSGDASDSIGSNTLTNVNTTSFASGKINNGADLEAGSSQGFTNSTYAQDLGQQSVSCWIKPESLPTSGNYMGLITKYQTASTTGGIDLRLYNDSGTQKIQWIVYGSGDGITSYTVTLTTGVWYHICGVYDGVYNRLYLNGSEVSSASYSGTVSTTARNLTVGCSDIASGNTRFFDGMIDEVSLFNRALTANEVAELYSSGSGEQYPWVGINFSASVLSSVFNSLTPTIAIESLKNDLVCYYKMEGNSNDSVGSKNGTDVSILYSTDYGKVLQGAAVITNGGYIQLPDTAKGGNSMSMSIWVYPTIGSKAIYSESESAYANLDITTDEAITFHVKTSTASYVSFNSPTGSCPIGRWNHIVRTYNATTGYLKGYINGVEVVSQLIGGNQSYNNTPNNNVLGTYNQGAGPTVGAPLLGYIDEVGIWSRALTQEEVTQLYNSGSGLQYPFRDALVSAGVLVARFFSIGFINLISKGISSMRSRGEKYLLGMNDKSVL